MPKFNLQRFSFHYGQNIKPLSFELQVKRGLLKIESNSYNGIMLVQHRILTAEPLRAQRIRHPSHWTKFGRQRSGMKWLRDRVQRG